VPCKSGITGSGSLNRHHVCYRYSDTPLSPLAKKTLRPNDKTCIKYQEVFIGVKIGRNARVPIYLGSIWDDPEKGGIK
jgi:hypothetical protein